MKNILKTLALWACLVQGFNGYAQDFWEQLSCDGGGPYFDILVDGQGRIFVARMDAASYGGIYRSDDNAQTWMHMSNGLIHPTVYSIAHKPDSMLFIATSGGMYRSKNLGENWEWRYDASQEDWQNCAIEYGYDSILLVSGGAKNSIYRSTDDGTTLKLVLNLYHPLHWEYVTDFLFGPNNIIYACSRYTNNWSNDNPKVYRSTDYGRTWQVFYDPHEPCGFISLEFNHAGNLLVGAFDAVYTYNFTTETWRKDNYNTIVSDFLLAPDSGVYMAGDISGGGWGGVALSEDDGATFPTVLNSGLVNNMANTFAKDLNGRILLISINHLYRSIDTIFVGLKDAEKPKAFIAACYPNPFYRHTTFKLTTTNIAILSIYNLAGQVLHTIEIPPNSHYSLNATALPKGVFIAKLSSDSQNQTIKLIHY